MSLLSIEKKELVTCLTELKSIIDSKASLPCLKWVLIDWKKGTFTAMTLSGHATSMTIKPKSVVGASTDPLVLTEDKSCVDLKTMLQAVKSTKQKYVNLYIEEGKALAVNMESSVKLEDVSEYPVVPDPMKAKMRVSRKLENAGDRLAKFANYCTDTTDYRPQLEGVYVELYDNGDTNLVATNSYALAVENYKMIDVQEKPLHEFIIPATACKLAKGMGNAVMTKFELQNNMKQVAIMNKNKVITTYVIEGNFPNWRDITKSWAVPSQYVSMHAQSVVDVSKTCKGLQMSKTKWNKAPMVFHFTNKANSMSVTAKNDENGAHLTLGVALKACELESEKFEVQFDSKLFERAMTLFAESEWVEMNGTKNNTVFFLREAGRTELVAVMPMYMV